MPVFSYIDKFIIMNLYLYSDTDVRKTSTKSSAPQWKLEPGSGAKNGHARASLLLRDHFSLLLFIL
jgi:hypothetical protein